MANEGHVHVVDKNELHDAITKLHEWRGVYGGRIDDLVTKIGKLEAGEATPLVQLRDETKEQRKLLDDMLVRLDAFDKILPKGQKLMAATTDDPNNTQARQAAREMLMRCIGDLVSFRRTGKTMFDTGIMEKRASGDQKETVDADGGYTVPVETSNELITLQYMYGAARQFCTVVPMTSRTLRLPTSKVLPDVYWDWENPPAELLAPTGTKITFARPELVAHKLIGTTVFSIELDEDSIVTFSSLLANVFAKALARKEDQQCFLGLGSGGEFLGIVTAIAAIAAQVATGSDNTYEACLTSTGVTGGYNKLLEVMAKARTGSGVVQNGTWVYSSNMGIAIRKVKDAQERPLWGEMMGTAPNTLFGRPVLNADIMPATTDTGSQASTAFILYGDGSYYYMGDRRQISIDVDSSIKFMEAGLALRAMERIAFVPALTETFGVLATTA